MAQRGRPRKSVGAQAAKPAKAVKESKPESYRYPGADSPLRPEAGTQAQFKKKKPPQTYRYDSSLSPVLEWDGQNAARESGEEQLAVLERELGEIKRQGLGARDQGPGEEKNRQSSPLAPIPSSLSSNSSSLTPSPSSLAPSPSSLAPSPSSDLEGNLKRAGEALATLKSLSKPFLTWSGKAERLSFDVPTLPLFVHERLSTKGIIETLSGHRKPLTEQLDLFGDPRHSITDQVLRAYEYRDQWVNRMVLGDSLVVMNSLLHYEGLGGQVQMIYMDPPYGVKFGSNFQPFVRKRDVKHNEDEDMTREPEMVKAYRDTWELGLHSYLTYMRDRLLLSRDLLTPSGSIFVQISDENLHHVRELMDEVFGAENFCAAITFKKTSSASGNLLSVVSDFLLWYARDITRVKYRQVYLGRAGEGWVNYDYVRLPDGVHRRMTIEERVDWGKLPSGGRVYRRDNLTSQRPNQEGDVRAFTFQSKTYTPGKGTFKTDLQGLDNLVKAERLEAYGTTLSYRRFCDDFPYLPLNNLWEDTLTGGFVENRLYVVQTTPRVIERCLLMTTDPSDLVLDPTCGSGTTAYVAEQWGRRWITVDTSRVPLALARQRILTATFPWYALKEEDRGPAGGFEYKRKQNTKGEEVGGIVPHVTLKSIANSEPPQEEVLVDRPEVKSGITRISGPFVVEATIPTPVDWEGDGIEDSGAGASESYGSFVDRMVEVLRKSPILHLGGGKTVTLKHVRPPAKTLSLSAEAMAERGQGPGARGEEEKGPGTRGQGPGERDASEVVQGSDRVAKSHGAGKGSIQAEHALATGGTLRIDQPDAKGCGFSAQQHRGGSQPKDERGVPSVSGACEGIPGGTGNTDSPCEGTSGNSPNRGGTGTASGRGSQQDSRGPDAVAGPWPLTPGPCPVAIVFGPENGAVSEKLVYEAAREAHAKGYSHLYVIGFAIQPDGRKLIENCEEAVSIAATYVQATPDLMMGDLLKNMRSSQIFSVCGLPEIELRRIDDKGLGARGQGLGKDKNRQPSSLAPGPWPLPSCPSPHKFQVELKGLDVFDPATMETQAMRAEDVPAWFLDTDYNGLCFHVSQAFFPRTSAWESLKKALKGTYDESVWDHLAGTVSAPFEGGDHAQIAVKVIDDRGNELMVVKPLTEAKP